MSNFIHNDFLLQTPEAERLYHKYAEDAPIIDFHSHLPAEDIAIDRRFENITQAWLAGDHYKWRAMRINGVSEKYCTGNASDRDKFQKWAETVPKTLCNPLYHWTHMELSRVFGITDRLLNPETAEGIWEECNAKLIQPEYSCRKIMENMNVALVCTTDDPADSLEHHQTIRNDSTATITVLPTFRPDKARAVEDPDIFNRWTARLAQAADMEIGDFDSFLAALKRRHDDFAAVGCCISDHGLDLVYADECTHSEAIAIFAKLRDGTNLDSSEISKFNSIMLCELGLMDYDAGWVQQYHIGAFRNNSTRLLKSYGPDAGADSIGDASCVPALSRLLDRLDSEGRLPRTILYNLNPADNAPLVTMAGNFQDGSTPGKIQYGSAWWFCDNKSGMERQIDDLSNMGLLSRFVGMLTDSRSFLSFPRHEYFRRILCNILGRDIQDGLIPNDPELVGEMVRDICHDNAVRYFGL